jgi:hypothetical protein
MFLSGGGLQGLRVVPHRSGTGKLFAFGRAISRRVGRFVKSIVTMISIVYRYRLSAVISVP